MLRSKVMVVMMVVTAMLGTSAVSAASALASPEWYAKTGGVFHKLTSALKVTSSGNLDLIDSPVVSGTKLEASLSCVVGIKGAIEAGGVGKVEEYTANSCKFSGSSGVTCGSPMTAEAIHIPWKTELYADGSEIRERLLSGGSGTPEWHFHCASSLGIFKEDTCGFNTSAHLINTALGDVEAEFEEMSNKTYCSWGAGLSGKQNTGSLKGVVTLAKPEGVEAIKAE